MTSLKVLQLGKFYPIRGGVEKVMYDLMTGLSEQGVRCDMLCAVEGKSETIRLNDHANLICCHAVKKVAATMISPSMVWTLRKICREYDIIHIHHPDPMACLALFLSGYKGRVILHWHSDILKQKNLLKLYRPLQRWLINRAERIVGTTPLYLQESPFLTDVQEKTVCVPIGIVPPADDSGNPAGKEIRQQFPDKTIIFSLGRLVEYKGFEHLIEAARYLNDRFVILIGGSGPLKEQLQAKIDHFGLGKKVKLLGFLSEKELPAYYKACDLFCLSSVYKTEAFGIVQIEAMSYAKPVVATTIEGSGVHWVNAEGESGLNAKKGDARALAKAMRAITSHPMIYARYSEGAKQRFKAMFTLEKMVNNMLAVYTQKEETR